jgi:glutathionyl-hydroquinone reductase
MISGSLLIAQRRSSYGCAHSDARSVIDQYADDARDQYRTEHGIDRFNCVAVPHCPHGERALVTRTIFKSPDLHEVQNSQARSSPKAAAFSRRAPALLRPWSFGIISVASIARAEEEFRISIHGRRRYKRYVHGLWRLAFEEFTCPSTVSWG